MKPSDIVWTAVTAGVAGVGAIVSAVLGSIEWIVAFGSVGVISALLSNRER